MGFGGDGGVAGGGDVAVWQASQETQPVPFVCPFVFRSLASEKARFSALKVGYDTGRDQGGSVQADDDIDDGGDDLVVSNPFGSTAITPTHDP